MDPAHLIAPIENMIDNILLQGRRECCNWIYTASAENLHRKCGKFKIYITSAKNLPHERSECGKFFSTSDVNFKFSARAM